VERVVGGRQARRRADIGALEPVVHRLRRRKERVRPVEDEPAHIEADIPLQRHKAVQQLGDAPAISGGIDVGDTLSFQLARQREDLRERGPPDDRAVLGQTFLRDANFFHGNPYAPRPRQGPVSEDYLSVLPRPTSPWPESSCKGSRKRTTARPPSRDWTSRTRKTSSSSSWDR